MSYNLTLQYNKNPEIVNLVNLIGAGRVTCFCRSRRIFILLSHQAAVERGVGRRNRPRSRLQFQGTLAFFMVGSVSWQAARVPEAQEHRVKRQSRTRLQSSRNTGTRIHKTRDRNSAEAILGGGDQSL